MTWNYDWNATNEQRLRVLWLADTPTKEIAKQLGTTKSAVISKARRMKLPRHAKAHPWSTRTKKRYASHFRALAS